MQNQFLFGKKQLLNSWKTIRSSLTSDLNDKDHLIIVSKYWSMAPLSSHIIDWDQPQGWPDPWKLMHDGNFDDSCIAIGQFYTLLLSADERWNTSRLKLMLVNDKIRSLQCIILEVDNRWILNLEYNTIVDKVKMKSKLWIQQKYNYDGKNHSITP